MNKELNPRRRFLKQLSGTLASTALMPVVANALEPRVKKIYILKKRQKRSANDRINVACIGLGIMGFGDVDTALTCNGVEFIAAADVYQGHLQKVKEVYGEGVKTTMDYQEILDNPSVDAVIIATPDHWHVPIAIAAMKKGKAVYCEKPLVHRIDEGENLIAVYRQNRVPFQVGSQWASALTMQEARKLYQEGAIGELNYAEAYYDRFNALGAWQYSIPPDASIETCDWNRFLGSAPKVPFDPIRFFRWRNYKAYGTGMAGDLFVHLFTRLHTITGSLGPEKIYTTGGLRYWKDGRDVPDVMLGLFDYPETEAHPAFNLSLRVNFVDGSGGGSQVRLVGSEGEMILGDQDITIRKKKLPKAPGYGGWDTFNTFPKATQEAFVKAYDKRYGDIKPEIIPPPEVVYQSPKDYDMRKDHFNNWFDAIRSGGTTIEDPVFGLRTAGPALAANLSQQENRIIQWDPINMQLV